MGGSGTRARSHVSDGTERGRGLGVEGGQPSMPSTGDEPTRGGAGGHVAPSDVERPARRRRSALVGGGVLVAASPAAVAAGLFVPGFAALGLGALLLLLPPRVPGERGHRLPWGIVRTPAAAGGRGMVVIARGT